jgi:hypothetical protein
LIAIEFNHFMIEVNQIKSFQISQMARLFQRKPVAVFESLTPTA